VERALPLIAEPEPGRPLLYFRSLFIPAYPDWVWAVPPGRGKILSQMYADFLAQCRRCPGAASETAGRAARESRAYVVMGVTERDTAPVGPACTTPPLLQSEGTPDGQTPKAGTTGASGLVWAQGDGSTWRFTIPPAGRSEG